MPEILLYCSFVIENGCTFEHRLFLEILNCPFELFLKNKLINKNQDLIYLEI